MEDIEDLEDVGPDPRASRSIHTHVNVEQRVPEAGNEQSTVPGTQHIWLKTFGCAHNTSDAEYMAGALQEYGYR